MKDTFETGLSPAQAERLVMLVEETGEFMMAAAGLPLAIAKNAPAPRHELARECADILAVSLLFRPDLSIPSRLATPAEIEDPAMHLVELTGAAGRVGQIACKCLRHGYGSFHPDDPHRDNRRLLGEALADFLALVEKDTDFMSEEDISPADTLARKLEYSHFQDHPYA